MTQFRFDVQGVRALLSDLESNWIWRKGDTWEEDWNYNLTRVIDLLRFWCEDHGIATYSMGYTQIELCVTIGQRSEAMLFKLRWHGAQTR